MASRTAAGVRPDLLPPDVRPAPKPKSAAAKGTYYRDRTKTYYEKRGYHVIYLERMAWIKRWGQECAACGMAPMFPTKSDQAGSDLLMFKGDDLAFVQVKLGRDSVMAARRAFVTFPFPPTARRLIVVWERGDRDPDVIDCTNDTPETLPERRARPRTDRLF